LAAALVARKLGAAPEAAAAVRTLREVEPAIVAAHGAGLAGQVCGCACACVRVCECKLGERERVCVCVCVCVWC
jgi:hypothetical protein